jgi:hypothetical protein
MKTIRIVLLAVTAAAFIFGCAGGPSAGGGKASGPPLYYGQGQGDSQIAAMNDAKMSAVQKAVVEMIGIASEAANNQKISERIYSAGNANKFVKNETMQILRREQQGDAWNVEIMIAVDLYTVERTLRDAAVYGNKVAPGSELGSGAVGAKGSPAPEGAAAGTASGEKGGSQTAAAEDEDTSAAAEPTPEQRSFINNYIENMRYMVYFDEESAQDPFLMKSAVGIANSYLASQAIQAVDYEQIESIKEDQQMAYEEQTGMEISIIQWIAQKLNADVYIELDAETSGETEGGNHYGKAMITLKIFESSTGNLLGSVPYTSPRTFSKSSRMDAVNNALQSSIYKAMPLAMDQVKSYMRKALQDGIVYDLVVQNTPDPKLMSDFRRKLKRKVSELRTLSSSAEETKYQVSFFGTIEDLEDLVYDVSESMPGLEGMYRVYFRGKSITFDTGLY